MLQQLISVEEILINTITMEDIGQEVYTALKNGTIQLEDWNNDKLRMVGYVVKYCKGNLMDFYSIAKAAFDGRYGESKAFFESVDATKFIEDDKILKTLGLKYDWGDDGIVFSQEGIRTDFKDQTEAIPQTYQEEEGESLIAVEQMKLREDRSKPELHNNDAADSSKSSFQIEQEQQVVSIQQKVPLLLPERAETSIALELLGVPKLEEVSQMSPYKEWDRTKSGLRTANERLNSAKDLAPVKQLLGEFWGDGELHVLFADTGVGKSLLAVDIADHLSRGKSLLGLSNECEALKTIYYDFELTDRQFRKRYSNEENEQYQFSENLFSDHIDTTVMSSANLCNHIMDKITSDVIDIGVKIVIIDNITFLVMQSTADQDVAIRMMQRLDKLKKEKDVSILVLAHTPKIDRLLPLTVNSLGGSKMISNFADSISAIGKSSTGTNFRYWKQIKCRQFEERYGESNVLEMEFSKADKKIEYSKIGTGSEYDYLPKSKAKVKDADKEVVLQLRSVGKSVREIEKETGVSKSTVARWLKALEEEQ